MVRFSNRQKHQPRPVRSSWSMVEVFYIRIIRRRNESESNKGNFPDPTREDLKCLDSRKNLRFLEIIHDAGAGISVNRIVSEFQRSQCPVLKMGEAAEERNLRNQLIKFMKLGLVEKIYLDVYERQHIQELIDKAKKDWKEEIDINVEVEKLRTAKPDREKTSAGNHVCGTRILRELVYLVDNYPDGGKNGKNIKE